MSAFEDIVMLDDRSLQMKAREVDTKDWSRRAFAGPAPKLLTSSTQEHVEACGRHAA